MGSVRHGPVGLFGKIASQGDFFRAEVAAPVVQALISWLPEAMEPLYRLGLKLKPTPIRFLFRAPPAREVLIGVLAPGQDKVGRSFPLCAFAPVAGAALETGFAAVPAVYRGFLDAAAALVTSASAEDGAALVARARALALPADDALEPGRLHLQQAARQAPVRELVQRLFGDLPDGAVAYALGTLSTAARPLRGREPPRASVALECPAETDVDRYAWLELARAALRWPAPPPFFWTEGAPGRIVVSLGGPPAALLGHLADAAGAGSKIWPLRTAQAAAIEAARRALPPAARGEVDGPGGSVEALIAAV